MYKFLINNISTIKKIFMNISQTSIKLIKGEDLIKLPFDIKTY